MSDAQVLAEALEAVFRQEGVSLPPGLAQGCGQHFAGVVRWNRTHNLTRVTSAASAAVTHYYDCIRPLLEMEAPSSFVDIGSGAGFPGMVAALVWPRAEATLVEPARKRASFLKLVAGQLGRKVSVVDPETVHGSLVLSRATFPPEQGEHLWGYVQPGGTLAVWTTPEDEIMWRDRASTWSAGAVTSFSYPGEHGKERRFVRILRA